MKECRIFSYAGNMNVAGEFIPSTPAEYQVFRRDLLRRLKSTHYSAIFIDEVQFLSKKQVEDFYRIVHDFALPVLCYGLKNNFKSELFAGSKRLIELADDLQEIRCICHCGKRARQNARVVNGRIVKTGAEVVMGDVQAKADVSDVYYVSLCNDCYYRGKIQ